MKTEIIQHETELFIQTLTPEAGADHYVLFVHGGPGSHSAYFEAAIHTFPSYEKVPVGWVLYDHRGCGRSATDSVDTLSHGGNIEDLASLCTTLEPQLKAPLRGVFGHSYGARLAYDTFRHNPEFNLKLLLAGRSAYSVDSMNQSTLMDLYILRDSDPEKFAEAYEMVAAHRGLASELFPMVRKMLPEPLRQKQRLNYYWGNPKAAAWYEQLKETVPHKESDAVFGAIRKTSKEDPLRRFDPTALRQECLLIKGYWDFMMAGATFQGLSERVVTFNGSGHYPHMEEPERFVDLVAEFMAHPFI